MIDLRLSTRPRASRVAPVALVVATGATILTVASQRVLPNELHVALVLTACIAYVTMLTAQSRWSGLTIRLVALAVAAQTAVAVLVPPTATQDLWWYAIYGRILAVYHSSPYTHVAADFPHDPLVKLVGHTWKHTPSVYGPAFTGLSAVAATVFGAAQLPTRFFYQGLAAVAVVIACRIVWRRTRSAGAVAFLALNPVVALYLINGGRNDILVGLAMLGAVVLAADGRESAAGVVGGLGALVKLTGLVGVVALLVSVGMRRGRGAAVRLGSAAAAVVALGYVLAGPAALLTPMGTAGSLFSRSSAWKLPAAVGIGLPPTRVALGLVGLTVLVVLFRTRHEPASTTVPAALTTLTVGAAYTLPGYAAWSLPTAALDHTSRVSRIVAAQAVALVAAYEVFRHPFAGPVGHALMAVALLGGPFVLAGLLVALLRTKGGAGGPDRPSEIALDPRREDPMVALRELSPIATLIVVPTYNERENIEVLLREVRAAAPSADVLVVDDASPDHTADLAESLAGELGGITVLRRAGPTGLGSAYRAGFTWGLDRGYDVLVEMDADLSHDPKAVPALLDALGRGADLAVGSRYVPGGGTVNWSLSRRVISRVGGGYARRMLRVPVHDVTSGFRAYRASLLREIELGSVHAHGYGFQIEMTHRANQLGADISEVPIVFKDREAGVSKMSFAIVAEALTLVTRWGVQSRLHHSSAIGVPAAVHPA
jgi:dolichol-phosphate mannosyltransferase